MSVVILVPSTPAVREYQKLQSVINSRIAETNQPAEWRFWNQRLHTQATEIASEYDLSVIELVDAWLEWCDKVDAARADYIAKAGA
jgi:hypothetical protein